jgi:hypothetical protein
VRQQSPDQRSDADVERASGWAAWRLTAASSGARTTRRIDADAVPEVRLTGSWRSIFEFNAGGELSAAAAGGYAEDAAAVLPTGYRLRRSSTAVTSTAKVLRIAAAMLLAACASAPVRLPAELSTSRPARRWSWWPSCCARAPRVDVAANARDYATVVAVEANRSGKYSQYLLHRWSTVDRRMALPAEAGRLVIEPMDACWS